MVKKRGKSDKGQKDLTLGILTHVLGYVSSFLGPLVILLASKEDYGKNHSRLALNWQFSLIIYLALVLPVFLFYPDSLWFVIGGMGIFFILGALNIVFCIIAAVKASNKEYWKYPLSIPFFRVRNN